MTVSDLLAQIQRSDDRDWLAEMRGLVNESEEFGEQQKFELRIAIDERFSQLNAVELLKQQNP